MKRIFNCRHFALTLIVVLVFCAGSAAQQVSGKQGVAATAKQTEVSQLRKAGLDEALAGKFEAGLAKLRKAAKLDPADKTVSRAIELLQSHMQRSARSTAERNREYQYELKRIKWAYLAQEHFEKPDKASYIKEFRKKIRTDLADAYNAIGTVTGLEEATNTEAEKIKAGSLVNIAKARKAVADAAGLIAKDKSDYAEEFRSKAAALNKCLDESKSVWTSVDPSTPKSRWRGANKLQAVQDKLADAMIDIETLVAKDPWKLALIHGRIAGQIAPNKDKLLNQLWYIELLKDAEARGRKAISQAKWYDALNAYTALGELESANKTYKAELAKVRRHVRVLKLYGKEDNGDEDNGDTKTPATKPADEQHDEPVWKEIVAGVDAQMARKAISKLGTSYVKPVDYRKLTKGAIESIMVLVTTPQVAETFETLKDKIRLGRFVSSLEKELKDIQQKDRIDHIRLQMALNKVLFSSEKTVKIPPEVLVVEFADGFLSELDKFSSMIWPHDVTNFNKSTMGHFTGIGVQITKEPNKPLKVITPLLNTPAYHEGIKAGDLILEVDGVGTKKETIDKIIKRIMGPPGTTVVLTIKRRGVAKLFKVSVVRRAVRVRTVKGWRRNDKGEWTYLLHPDRKIGYIRITQFTRTTHKNLNKALKAMKAAGVRSLVLDLRSNPGGLLQSATEVANEFLKKAGRIVYTRGRQVARNEINANSRGTYLDDDLVVLVDEGSASAAEILSGALKDWRRAMIVGQRSYGKGSVQNVIPVRGDKAFLKLTTAHYYLPSGRCLHREPASTDWGVNPDVEVIITPRQMLQWLRLRRKTDLLQEFVPELLQADLKQQYDADMQLNTAVLMLELMKLRRQAELSGSKFFAADNSTERPS